MKGKIVLKDDVESLGEKLDKVGAKDESILKEIWLLARRKVKNVRASDKLRALELIAKMRGWLKDGEVGIQQNILIELNRDDKRIREYINESKRVIDEIT